MPLVGEQMALLPMNQGSWWLAKRIQNGSSAKSK
jgi:hypothetical protein